MRSELGESGKAIWDAYESDKLDAGQRALVLEFARCADTADRLADLAAGRRESWASIVFDDMGEVHLQVDKILDQVRSNQVVLRGLHAEVRQTGIKAGQRVQTPTADEEPEDMIAKRRKEREERERKLG